MVVIRTPRMERSKSGVCLQRLSADALLTQRTFCQDLSDADADYVMPVKKNQETLFDDIRKVFEPSAGAKPGSHHTEMLKKHVMILAHIWIFTKQLKREWLDPNAQDDNQHCAYKLCGVAGFCSSLAEFHDKRCFNLNG